MSTQEALADEPDLVSVVIPTVGRPTLIDAVKSVQQQRVATEVIVVLDAPSQRENVTVMLKGFHHRLLETQGRVGGAVARNIGLRNASGTYIAYLDDDDTWEPDKLSIQLRALADARNPRRAVCVAATKFVRTTGRGEDTQILPAEPYSSHEQGIGDYLVQRENLRYGRTFMQTSSIVGSADIMRLFPWNEDLRKHQDWDLFCRLFSKESTVEAVQVSTPLVTVYQRSIGSISHHPNWEASATWYRVHAENLSRRGRADFLWTHVLRASLAQRSWSGLRFWARYVTDGLPHVAAVVVGVSGVRGR